MPARRRAREAPRRLREARRRGEPGTAPAPSPEAVRRAEEDAAWRAHTQGDCPCCRGEV